MAAARRIKGSSINWSELAALVPEEQKSHYVAFKTRSDNYLRRMLSYPEQPPKIDWSYYQARIAVPGMVEDFRKKYDALTIPFPKNTLSSELDKLKVDTENKIKKLLSESNARIVEYKKEIEKTEAIIPYDLMTMDEFKDAHPELAHDTFNNPTYWPHDPEEQLTEEDIAQGLVGKDNGH